jgi:hypothetical protein
VAVTFAIWAAVCGFQLKEDPDNLGALIVNLIICGLFVFLGAWSSKKPFAALVSGAALYGVILVLNMITNPITIVQGIFIKIFIIAALITGIKAAMDAEKMQKATHLK